MEERAEMSVGKDTREVLGELGRVKGIEMSQEELEKYLADMQESEAAELRAEQQRRADQARRDREIAEQDRKERIERDLNRFPKRYKFASFENYILYQDDDSRIAQQHTIECLRSGNSLVMYGKNGTGKTHLGYAFLREKITDGEYCKYILAPDLFDEIKSVYAKDSYDTSKALIERYAKYDRLIIDELDKTFGTPSEFIGLYRIINRRYDDLKSTIIMTNGDDDTVISIVGRSCYERLIEYPGTAVKMEWKSFRARGEK